MRLDPRDHLLAGAERADRQHVVAPRRGLVDVEDGLVARVDLGVTADPGAHRGPAVGVGAQRVKRLGGRAQLAHHLRGELAEQVLLAGEVLVEGNSRAATELRDPVDAAAVIALVAEDLQRRVENSLMGAMSSGPDARILGERSSANHPWTLR